MTEADCVIWRGRKDIRGYGRRTFGGQSGLLAHRVAYEYANGPIPNGMTVDHLCFNPPCVNPEHLRLLTPSDNAKNQRSAAKTHCVNGHEFTPENTYIKTAFRTGRRQCRACNRAAVARYKSRSAA